MRRLFEYLVLIAVIGASGYFIYTREGALNRIEAELGLRSPCAAPLTYSLVAVDPRFGISSSTALGDLAEAARIWMEPAGKDLFRYEPSGGEVSVRFVYDDRQAATDKLASLGIIIDSSKATYDTLQARYDALKQKIDSERAAYEAKIAGFRQDEDAYNAQVAEWNARGGAPQAVYDELARQKSSLAAAFAAIKQLEAAMNGDIDTLNALATTINQLIVQLNLNVEQYNGAGEAAGAFEEGLYEDAGGVESISIYEFSGHAQLVRVLAHELGHALGLQHISDPRAIMYKINSGSSLQAEPEDVAELDRVCGFK